MDDTRFEAIKALVRQATTKKVTAKDLAADVISIAEDVAREVNEGGVLEQIDFLTEHTGYLRVAAMLRHKKKP